MCVNINTDSNTPAGESTILARTDAHKSSRALLYDGGPHGQEEAVGQGRGGKSPRVLQHRRTAAQITASALESVDCFPNAHGTKQVKVQATLVHLRNACHAHRRAKRDGGLICVMWELQVFGSQEIEGMRTMGVAKDQSVSPSPAGSPLGVNRATSLDAALIAARR